MRRLFPVLLGLGVAATASMLLVPIERIVPADTGLPPMALRATALIQPIVLLTILVAVGCWAAPKLGLDAPLIRALIERRPAGPVLRRQAGPAVGVAVIVAAILLLFGWLSADWFRGSALAGFEMPVATRLLYGGITEELLTRWGLMSLLAWVAWKAAGSRSPVPAACFWIAAVVGALLFAAGHLPLLHLVMPSPPAIVVAAVLVGNSVPGLLFGLLFWKRGLEAAMIAHALAHLLGALAAGLVLGN